MEDGQMFCDDCGYRVENGEGSKAKPYTIQIRDKSAGIAALLSFFFVGVGQIYAGKIARGLLLMFVGFALYAFTLVATVAFASELYDAGTFDDLVGVAAGVVLVSLIVMVCYIILWVWNIFDAYKLANKYNDFLMENGIRPW